MKSCKSRDPLLFVCAFAVLVIGLATPLTTRAQTGNDAAIEKLVLSGYQAYAKRDGTTLLSMFSQHSPHVAELKLLLEQDFAITQKFKVESLRVNLLRKLTFESDNATARVLVVIGAVDAETGKVAEGYGAMDHTLRLVRENGTWKFWQVKETSEELAADLLAAKDDQERVVLLAKAEPFTGGLIRGLANQAQVLTEAKADYANAILIFNTLLKIGSQKFEPLAVGNALVGLGDIHLAQGNYLRAADNYQQVLTLAEGLHSNQGIAAVSIKMGNVHYHQGNFALAMEYYQKSLKAYEELGSKIEIAYPLLSIGNAYFSRGNYASALDSYRRSLKIYEDIFDKGGTAYLLERIAQVYAAQGKYPEAIEGYTRSLKLQEELGNKALAAYALNNMGKVHYARGNYGEAADVSTRATLLAREGQNPEVLWQTLTSHGKALRALKQDDQARKSFNDAITAIEHLRRTVVGNEREQELFFESRTVPYHAMIDMLMQRNDQKQAFAMAERAKGRVLLDVLQSGRENVLGAMTAEERREEKLRNEAIVGVNVQLRRESMQSKPEGARTATLEAQLNKARLEYETFQTRLYASHPELKVSRGHTPTLELDEAVSLLPDSKTAVLEYVVTEEKVYLFVIKRNETSTSERRTISLRVFPLDIKPQDLSSRIVKLRETISGNALGFRGPSRELYDLLIKPAQAQLGGVTSLCVIPDGALWELPFQALLSDNDKYLLENYSIYYVPSLSILREIRKRTDKRASGVRALPNSAGVPASHGAVIRPSPPQTLLAFGNPELNTAMVSRARSINRDETLLPLPEAEREVKSLTQFYNLAETKVLVGPAALEETFKKEAGNFRVLHFATHGTLDDSNPMYSRLVLASSTDGEDGFLEAREIDNLNLNADLVVLSACQTARGRVAAGEGLIGMTWAFFVAGSPTTVASQWKVDSASTTQLMINFHQQLTVVPSKTESRITKAEALRRAALKLLADAKYRHPFYWAGFVMVGDGG